MVLHNQPTDRPSVQQTDRPLTIHGTARLCNYQGGHDVKALITDHVPERAVDALIGRILIVRALES